MSCFLMVFLLQHVHCTVTFPDKCAVLNYDKYIKCTSNQPSRQIEDREDRHDINAMFNKINEVCKIPDEKQ